MGDLPKINGKIGKTNSQTETFSHPVDAGGDGGEVGAFVFLLDEVAEAGKKLHFSQIFVAFVKPGKDESGYENEHQHQAQLAD